MLGYSYGLPRGVFGRHLSLGLLAVRGVMVCEPDIHEALKVVQEVQKGSHCVGVVFEEPVAQIGEDPCAAVLLLIRLIHTNEKVVGLTDPAKAFPACLSAIWAPMRALESGHGFLAAKDFRLVKKLAVVH